MGERYFIRIRGSTPGPFRKDQVWQLLQRGKIGPLQETSTDGTTRRPLQEFPDFVPIGSRRARPSLRAPTQQGEKPASAPKTTAPPPNPGKTWCYELLGQQDGPVEETLMVSRIEAGRIGPDSLGRSNQMSHWTPLEQTELARDVPARPPKQEEPSSDVPQQKT